MAFCDLGTTRWCRPTPALWLSPLMVAVAAFTILAVALIAVVLVVLARAGRTLLEDRLGGIENRIDHRLTGLDERVDRRLEGLDGRLLSTQQSAGQTATQIVDDGTDASARRRARTARARAAATEGAWGLWRAAAREPSARSPPAIRVRDAVRLQER